MADCTSKGGFFTTGLYDGIGSCTPNSLNDAVIVATNILKILLQFGGVLAVVFVIVGGIMYISSAGDPARVAKAKATITNAVIGLIIAFSAIAIVQFVAGRF